MVRCFVCLDNMSRKFHQVVSTSFAKWGNFVYFHPCTVISLSLVVFVILAIGLSQYEFEDDNSKLWIPQHSQAIKDEKTVNEVFTKTHLEVIYVIGKDADLNLLSKDVFEEIHDFNEQLMTHVYKGQSFEEVCYKLQEGSPCRSPNSPLTFLETKAGEYDMDRVQTDEELLSLINSGRGQPEQFPEGSSNFISIQYMLGGTVPPQVQTFPDGTNNIESAKAMTWIYEIGDFEDYNFFKEYEAHLESFAQKFNKHSKLINIYWYTSMSIDIQNEHEMIRDANLFVIGFCMVLVYVMISVGKLHTYNSRMFIGFVGLLCIAKAFVEAMGLGSYLGMRGNVVTNALPFIMLGLGLDDMFVLLHILEQAPKGATGAEKMEYMMRHAGTSITVTSFTNTVSFSMGCLTSLPAIKSIGLYGGLGMFFDYFNQITIFAAILAYDIRRSEKLKGDCLGLVSCKPTSKSCCYGKYIYDQNGNVKEPQSRKFIREVFAPAMMSRLGRTIVILGVLSFSIFNTVCVFSLEKKFDFEWFVTENYYLYDTLAIRDKYFKMLPRSIRMYTVDTDFSDEENQRKTLEMVNAIGACRDCSSDWVIPYTTTSWYLAYNQWVSSGGCIVDNNTIVSIDVVPQEHFYPCLYQWQETLESAQYMADIVWTADKKIEGSTVNFLAKYTNNYQDFAIVMIDLRNLAELGPGNSFPFDFYILVGEQSASLIGEFVFALSCSGISVILIVFLIMGDIITAVFVLLIVLLVTTSMLALLNYMQIYINMLTMVSIIASVGVSVNFTAHVAFSFKNSPRSSRKERAIHALDEVGQSIFAGALSTFIAISMLFMSNSYAFVVFFICWVGIIIFGLLYGLVFLPVLLSICGPKSNFEKTSSDSADIQLISLLELPKPVNK